MGLCSGNTAPAGEPQLREAQAFIVGCQQTCPTLAPEVVILSIVLSRTANKPVLRWDYLQLPKLCAMQTPSKDSREQRAPNAPL